MPQCPQQVLQCTPLARRPEERPAIAAVPFSFLPLLQVRANSLEPLDSDSCLCKLNRQRLKQLILLAVAVRELVEPNAGFVEQRQVQIRQRSRFGVFEMAIPLQSRRAAAGNKDGQVRVIVNVRVADTAAVKIER